MYILGFLTFIIGLLGILAAALRGKESRKANKTVVVSGIMIAALTLIMNTFYSDNHWTIKKAIKQADEVIVTAKKDYEDLQRLTMDIDKRIDEEDTILSNLKRIRDLDEDLEILFSARSLDILPVAYADSHTDWVINPAIVNSPEFSKSKDFFFVGKAIANTPSKSKELSIKDAKDKARVYFSELIEAGEKPSEKKAKEMLLEKIVESYDIEEVLAGESAGSDKVGKNVLIKIPADMTIQKIKLYESHGVISDSGKYIKTIQNRK